jgi:hypothetical protein
VTQHERLMVQYLRVLVRDDDGALEVIEALDGTVRQWLEEVAELAAEPS